MEVRTCSSCNNWYRPCDKDYSVWDRLGYNIKPLQVMGICDKCARYPLHGETKDGVRVFMAGDDQKMIGSMPWMVLTGSDFSCSQYEICNKE